MIKDKTIFRNFIWNTIGSTFASFNSLFFLIIITRINGLENAGIFSICVTTAFLLYIFAIYSGRTCHITDIENKIKDKDYIVSRIFNCIFMMIVTLLYIIINNYDTYQSKILFFLCLWKAQEAFGDVFYGILQKRGKLYIVGQSLVLKSILGIVLFGLIDYFTNNLILSCSILPIVSIGILILFDYPKANKEMIKEEKVTMKNVLLIYKKEFFLFASAFLTMYLLNAPKYAIENYLTNEIQGIYAIILMPASILPLFAQFVSAPMMNDLTKYYKQKEYSKMKQIEHKLGGYILSFGFFAMFLAYIIGIPILKLIYKIDLSGYNLTLVLIIFAYIIYALGYIKTLILTIYRKIKEQFIIYLVSSIFMYILSNVLIKRFGEKGIIPTYLTIMSISYIMFNIYTRYKYKKN